MEEDFNTFIEKLKQQKICRKCVLPESRPDIFLDAEGICNVCRDFEKTKIENNKSVRLETDFLKILKKYKSKGKHDCLVMCSGGKDSTAALYYMKKRYKLNPLAFTFDHGFEVEDAMKNVKNAVEILGVDHLCFRSDYMKEMFSAILKENSKAVICHICSIWYMSLTLETAARYQIPLIIAGWTKGQYKKEPLTAKCGRGNCASGFVTMAKAARDFLDGYVKTNPKYKNFPKSMEEVLSRANAKQKYAVLSPHWFLPFDPDTYTDVIKRELRWECPKSSYPQFTTNCSLNFISVYNSIRNFGFTHYHAEMSNLIREDLMTRQEALDNLKINFDKALLNSVGEKLDHIFL